MPAWNLNPATGKYESTDGTPTPSWLTASSSKASVGTSAVNSSAKAIIPSQLQDWGLDTLSDKLDSLIKDGLGADAITLQLQESPEYKARFSANDARRKAGLPILTPAQYISAESSYRQVLQSYGLPSGFYDSRDDFANFIANDVSPDEVKQRAQDAQQVWLTTDQSVKDTWKSFYGLSDGAAIASILDPKTALPVVQRMTNAALIGAEASRNGLQSDRTRDEQYADLGVTQDQARKGFGEIGQTWSNVQGMSQRFDRSFTQTDAEKATLLGDAQALKTQQQLFSAEKGLFSATAAASDQSQTKRTTGSY